MVKLEDSAGGPPTGSYIPLRADLRVVAILFHSKPLALKVGVIRTVIYAACAPLVLRSRILRII